MTVKICQLIQERAVLRYSGDRERVVKMFDQLVDIIVNYVEVKKEDIKPESRFMEDLGFTSFDFMSMLGEVEETLDVEIDQEEAANIRTVQEAADYLSRIS